MPIELTGRGFEATIAIHKLARERLARISKYIPQANDAHIILSVEKDRKIAEIIIRGKGKTFTAREESGDMYQSLAAACEKIGRAVRKHMERKIDLRRRSKQDRFRIAVLEVEAEQGRDRGVDSLATRPTARIVRSRRYTAKFLSLEEAVAELERLRNPFVVFRNSETRRYNILYRRDDGNFGYLDLED